MSLFLFLLCLALQAPGRRLAVSKESKRPSQRSRALLAESSILTARTLSCTSRTSDASCRKAMHQQQACTSGLQNVLEDHGQLAIAKQARYLSRKPARPRVQFLQT